MSWLTEFFAAVLAKLAALLFGEVRAEIKKEQAEAAARAEAEREAQASVEPMKKAQTGKEVDDATDSDLNGV